jgi:hypothetical protein
VLPGGSFTEQEYHRRLPLHKIRIRPDIIVHVLFEIGIAEERDEGNVKRGKKTGTVGVTLSKRLGLVRVPFNDRSYLFGVDG